MASRIISNRCAVCGRTGHSLFTFALLVEAARKFNVPLKCPASVVLHDKCSRKAYAALIKKPIPSFLVGGIK